MGPFDFTLLVLGGAGALVLARHFGGVWDEEDYKDVREQAWALGELQKLVDEQRRIAAQKGAGLPVIPRPLPKDAEPLRMGILNAVPGRRYRAAVNISIFADEGDVRKQTQKKGFQNVVVTRTRPPDWPSGLIADWYVDGVYSAAPTTFDRRYALGLVKIQEVWEG